MIKLDEKIHVVYRRVHDMGKHPYEHPIKFYKSREEADKVCRIYEKNNKSGYFYHVLSYAISGWETSIGNNLGIPGKFNEETEMFE